MSHQTFMPRLIQRLKRAEGHLRGIITLAEGDAPCLKLAQQLHAVERAVAEAKRMIILDHIEHCLEGAAKGEGEGAREATEQFRTIIKHL
ncbi:metal-sensing transcriptional repressor [Acetobacteraceae bacterium H6797]|nr:metal-sensing transcriptional repressor [Acetobacteraceae bacterium H6797]